MYQYDQKPNTKISDACAAIISVLRDSEYSVLVGRNNCGKSFVLKSLTQQWGTNTSYLGPSRYQNFNLLGYFTPNRNRKNDKYNQFLNYWNRQHENIDNSPVNLQQAIAELSDQRRAQLSEIVKLLLGIELEILFTVTDNSMSQKYISCGGHNISYTSSGFRLITTLVTCLLDTDYDTFLIDEPELGISPEAQGLLADFLFDRKHRAKYFPHVKTLILATHSTIFLDRSHISNNYKISKVEDQITIERTQTQHEFNQIHFFLLGNRFETLYLPSAIILVEGKTDHKFIERALALQLPTSQLSVIAAHSDSRITEVLSIAKGLFTDFQKSPYRDRIFVVLDATHARGLPDQLVSMGIPKDRIIKWTKNGIEYFYPASILDEIYGVGGDISIENDEISRNGRTYKKNELADKVVALLQKDTRMHYEFEGLFLAQVRNLVAT